MKKEDDNDSNGAMSISADADEESDGYGIPPVAVL